MYRLFVVKFLPNELGGAGRGFEIARIAQHLRGTGESGNHQPVPGGDDLVVEMRPRTLVEQIQQFGTTRESIIDIGCSSRNVLPSPRAVPFVENIFAPQFSVRIASLGNVALASTP